jgi:hypothetical protein
MVAQRRDKMNRILKWFKAKAVKQSLFNVRINTRKLILVSNRADAAVAKTGAPNSSNTKEVVAAQKALLSDIHLAMANGASAKAVRENVDTAKATESVSHGAEMAILHVLSYVTDTPAK